MGAHFFQNGLSIGSTAGWCGYTGSNNYVVRYEFVTGSEGADTVRLGLSGIYYGSGAGTQSFGFKISESSVAFANARNTKPDSDYGIMRYGSEGYGCVLTATGLNLAPSKRYYIFVFVASAGAEYYSGWNCPEPEILCTGSYTLPGGSIVSVSSLVSTGEAVSVLVAGSPCPFHRAEFYCSDKLLGRSAVFGSSLSHICPRSYMAEDIYASSMSVELRVQGYEDEGCARPVGEAMPGSFTLRADAGMCPVIGEDAVSVTVLNEGAASGFDSLISGISRLKISFDPEKAELSACAGAEITGYAVKVKNDRRTSAEPVLETGVISGEAELVCSVTDSRGREGRVSIPLSPLPYVPPSLSQYEALRCDASGADDPLGEYYKLRFVTAATDVEGKNRCRVSVSCRAAGADWGGETELEGFEDGLWSDLWAKPAVLGGAMQGDSYTLALTVSDSLGSAARYTLGLYHQRWALKFNRRGTALGIGMEPGTENALQLPDSWRLYTGALVLSESSYGYGEPETAVPEPVDGQLYFLLTD